MNKQLTVQHLIHAKVINFVISQNKMKKKLKYNNKGLHFRELLNNYCRKWWIKMSNYSPVKNQGPLRGFHGN